MRLRHDALLALAAFAWRHRTDDSNSFKHPNADFATNRVDVRGVKRRFRDFSAGLRVETGFCHFDRNFRFRGYV
jgi:hypothetical protein